MYIICGSNGRVCMHIGISNDRNESLSGDKDASISSSASTLTVDEEQTIVCNIGPSSVELNDVLQSNNRTEQGSSQGRGKGSNQHRGRGGSQSRRQSSQSREQTSSGGSR